MRRHLTLCVVLALVALTAVAPIGAAAQDSPQPTTTAPENSTTTGDDVRQIEAEIDPATTVESIEYDGETQTFRLTIQSEMPSRLVISDNIAARKANQGASGMATAQIPQKRITLDAGTTTVTMQAAEWRGKTAITVATTRGAISINNGVTSGSPFAGASGTTGWLGGVGISLLMFVGAALYKLRGEGGEPVEGSP